VTEEKCCQDPEIEVHATESMPRVDDVVARMRVKTGIGSQLDEQTGGRHAGAKGLVVDPDAGAHDVALLVALLCTQKS